MTAAHENSSVDSEEEREERLARQKEMREARLKAAMESGSKDHLRSPSAASWATSTLVRACNHGNGGLLPSLATRACPRLCRSDRN